MDSDRQRFYRYLCRHYNIPEDARQYVTSILDWGYAQSMDKEDTTSYFMFMFKSLGITAEEIDPFICW